MNLKSETQLTIGGVASTNVANKRMANEDTDGVFLQQYSSFVTYFSKIFQNFPTLKIFLYS